MSDEIEPEVKPWITKLEVKDGDIVMLRWTPYDNDLSPEYWTKTLEHAKSVFRKALDEAGYPNVAVLAFMSDWEVAVIPAVDALGALASRVSADPEEEA